MYTSMIGLALSAALAAPAALAPAWQHDYRLARELGEREHKPLVVVIGSGSTDWAKLAKAAEQDETINPTLRSNYVCLFVDTDTYAWRAWDEVAVSAYWTGRYDEALGAAHRALAARPDDDRLRANVEWCEEALAARVDG